MNLKWLVFLVFGLAGLVLFFSIFDIGVLLQVCQNEPSTKNDTTVQYPLTPAPPFPTTVLFNHHIEQDPSLKTKEYQKPYLPGVAYAFLANKFGLTQALVAMHRARSLNLKYPILLLLPIGANVSVEQYINDTSVYRAFLKLDITFVPYDPLYMPNTFFSYANHPEYNLSFHKLYLFKMVNYKKIIFLDSDILINYDISNLAYMPAFSSVTLTCDERVDVIQINGGLLIVEPSETTFLELMKLGETKPFNGGWVYSEQELLAIYYLHLHPYQYYSLSPHHMMAVRGIDNAVFSDTKGGPHWFFPQMTKFEYLKTIQMIHFLCVAQKPWKMDKKLLAEDQDGEQKCAAEWWKHADAAMADLGFTM